MYPDCEVSMLVGWRSCRADRECPNPPTPGSRKPRGELCGEHWREEWFDLSLAEKSECWEDRETLGVLRLDTAGDIAIGEIEFLVLK